MRCSAEGVADDEEGNVVGFGAGEDGRRGGFDQLAVGEDYGAAVEGFEGGLRDEEEGGVAFEIDSGCAAHDFEAGVRDVMFVGEAEADEVEHCGAGARAGGGGCGGGGEKVILLVGWWG